VNTLHTGTITISGTAAVGQVLTATNNIADADGLGTFAYQWKRSGLAISGANASTYTLVAADNANTMTVTITYTDSKGFIETETSAATASVITPLTLGSGDDNKGYYLGLAGDGTSYMYVAPKSTQTQKSWGSHGTFRGTVSYTNGLANTNTLYAFGSAAHPAAYYCKSLTTGGYNTWYLPALDELATMYSNKSAIPFATANSFAGDYHWSSTDFDANYAWELDMSSGAKNHGHGKYNGSRFVRAARRSAV
jgi:hypothetical protein